MADFLPEADNEFRAWLGVFVAWLQDHPGAVPVDPADVAALAAAEVEFDARLDENEAAHAAAVAAREGKDASRADAERRARAAARQVQAAPGVADSQRRAMGLTPRGGRRRGRAPAPASRAAGSVVAVLPLRHVLRVTDDAHGGTPRRRRPRGSVGAEVWVRVADDPGREPAPERYLGLATDGEFAADFAPADAGRWAEYRLRWLGARGEPGPWGPGARAMIAA